MNTSTSGRWGLHEWKGASATPSGVSVYLHPSIGFRDFKYNNMIFVHMFQPFKKKRTQASDF